MVRRSMRRTFTLPSGQGRNFKRNCVPIITTAGINFYWLLGLYRGWFPLIGNRGPVESITRSIKTLLPSCRRRLLPFVSHAASQIAARQHDRPTEALGDSYRGFGITG